MRGLAYVFDNQIWIDQEGKESNFATGYENDDNFGDDIKLPPDELERVAHLATVAVHPAYRGNSLQSMMQGIHLDAAEKMGYEHACCMVSPKNRFSLKNILSQGLLIKAIKIKFGWRLRCIMHKDLEYLTGNLKGDLIGIPNEAEITSSSSASTHLHITKYSM